MVNRLEFSAHKIVIRKQSADWIISLCFTIQWTLINFQNSWKMYPRSTTSQISTWSKNTFFFYHSHWIMFSFQIKIFQFFHVQWKVQLHSCKNKQRPHGNSTHICSLQFLTDFWNISGLHAQMCGAGRRLTLESCTALKVYFPPNPPNTHPCPHLIQITIWACSFFLKAHL